ncbi:MAG: CopG family antitoxin [Nitrospinota bacterium]
MEKNKSKTKTIAEASEYYDEHDIFEHGDVQEVTGIKFRLQKKKYVGVDMALYKKIRSKAKKLRVTEDSLIREWLKQKVR